MGKKGSFVTMALYDGIGGLFCAHCALSPLFDETSNETSTFPCTKSFIVTYQNNDAVELDKGAIQCTNKLMMMTFHTCLKTINNCCCSPKNLPLVGAH